MPRLKAEADNIDTRFHDSCHTKTRFNNCLIIHFSNNLQKKIVLSEFARVHKHYMKEGFLEKLDQDHLITGSPDYWITGSRIN